LYLQRNEDVTGISGTGMVAEGVMWSDGVCAMRWVSDHRSTAIYHDLADILAIHGHDGSTKLIWIDFVNYD